MTLSKSKLDKAIANGEPLLLLIEGDQIVFTVTDYDRHMVRGFYANKGIRYDSTFHRSDVTLLNW